MTVSSPIRTQCPREDLVISLHCPSKEHLGRKAIQPSLTITLLPTRVTNSGLSFPRLCDCHPSESEKSPIKRLGTVAFSMLNQCLHQTTKPSHLGHEVLPANRNGLNFQ